MENLSDKDLLNYAIQNGIIDINTIQMKIEMNKRKKYLDKHEFSIWQGKNGLWYSYLPDDEKGRKLVKRKSQEEIENLVIDYYKNQDEEEKQKKKSEKINLLTVFPEWIDFKQIHTNSTSYIKRITADWTRFYEKEVEFINMPLHKMTKLFLDEWAHGIIKKYNLTKKSYYNMSMILRQCLDYAVEKGYIEENEFAKVKINTKLFQRTKKKTSDTQVYNEKEEEDFIKDMLRRFNNNPKSTAPLMAMFQFETGLRIGEICAVKETDIDGRYIHIQRQEVREFEKVNNSYKMRFKCFKIAEYTKTEDGFRDVYLTDLALKIIDIALYINKNNGEKNPEKFIFFKDGANINHYSMQAMIKRGCEAINIETKTSHKIRKTYISTLIDSGLNIDEIRRMVGHSDERTTYGNYCFNRMTNTQTEKTIENALNKQKVIKGNQILQFENCEKPSKYQHFAVI